MNTLDRSHDPARTSWVASASGHADFPIQNLPFGRVRTDDGQAHAASAIGDHVLLLTRAAAAGWGSDLPGDARSAGGADLMRFLAGTPTEWRAVRLALSDALSDTAWQGRLSDALVPARDVTSLLPVTPADYTDFYASIHHAANVGSMFRPDNPLLPNYKWVPIGYHGRASSIVVSGTPIRRPRGQLNPPGSMAPEYLPARSVDYELELGVIIGGRNAIGEVVPAASAPQRIFGVTLLNDWSARDIQSWEYQPLGPFLAKNFATTLSPWIVTTDALLPFRAAMPSRPEGDPAPLPYLRIPDDCTWRIVLDVTIASPAMRAVHQAFAVSHVAFDEAMYWSPAQLVAHHGSNGCNLQPGDVLGTGTISGPDVSARGCLLERTWRGTEPLTIAAGVQRRFLEDGDEVVMRGRCQASGAAMIGFGECRGMILPA